MSEKRYLVFYTGRTKPGVDHSTVKSNLVLSLGISDSKAKILLDGGRRLLKRCASSVDAQVLAEKFDQNGLLCEVCDGISGVSNPGVEAGSESSLVRVLKSFSSSSSDDEENSSVFSRLVKTSSSRKRA